MTVRTFAPWVQPIAASLRETRAQVVAFARSAPETFWDLPSLNPGWSNKDLLAHLATSHWVMQTYLRLVLDGVQFSFTGPDTGNAERIAARRNHDVAELITEVEAEGEATEDMLSRLTNRDENFHRGPAKAPFGDSLRALLAHAPHHLDQLRKGLEAAK
jgi:uncharacterized protein (TIGR03083 family)